MLLLAQDEGAAGCTQDNGIDAAMGGARRDEEKSRSKERVFSLRNSMGQWEPENQRPELWSLYNPRLKHGQSMRVFPLSNWTELDVWEYLQRENIQVVPLYFADERAMVVRGDFLIPLEPSAAFPGSRSIA